MALVFKSEFMFVGFKIWLVYILNAETWLPGIKISVLNSKLKIWMARHKVWKMVCMLPTNQQNSGLVIQMVCMLPESWFAMARGQIAIGLPKNSQKVQPWLLINNDCFRWDLKSIIMMAFDGI